MSDINVCLTGREGVRARERKLTLGRLKQTHRHMLRQENSCHSLHTCTCFTTFQNLIFTYVEEILNLLNWLIDSRWLQKWYGVGLLIISLRRHCHIIVFRML